MKLSVKETAKRNTLRTSILARPFNDLIAEFSI